MLQRDQDIAYEPQPRLGIRRQTLIVEERPWDDAWRAHQAWLRDGSPPLPDYDLDLGVLTIGTGIALVSNPTEFFVELGMEVRQSSPFRNTLISTLTNGNAGYVPTRRAFAEGGYEVKKHPATSFLAIDAGERIVAERVRMLTH